MSRKKLLRKPRRQMCIGDLRDLIQIRGREILPPAFQSAEFEEDFSDDPETWARVRTVTGKTLFDGVNQDVAITHEIGIRFDSSVTTQSWIELEDNRRLKIAAVDDLEERHDWMILLCSERGDKSLDATKA